MDKQIATQIIQKTKDDYNRIAAQFDSTRKYNWRDIAAIIDNLEIPKGSKVLDLGCGNGRLFELLCRYNVDYTGIDISEELIKAAKKKYPQAKFSIGDITNLKSSKKYDYIFSIAVLHHIPSAALRKKMLSDIKGALKDGGAAIVSAWYFWNQPKYIKEIVSQFLKLPITNSQFSNNLIIKKFIGNWKLASTEVNSGRLEIGNFILPFGDFYFPWKNSSGKVLARRYHHAWTAHEFRKNGFKIISKNRNLIARFDK